MNAAQTTESLITFLLPLGDQIRIRVLFVQAVLVDFASDGLLLVKHLVHITGTLMMNAEDGPHYFVLSLLSGIIILGCKEQRGESKMEISENKGKRVVTRTG